MSPLTGARNLEPSFLPGFKNVRTNVASVYAAATPGSNIVTPVPFPLEPPRRIAPLSTIYRAIPPTTEPWVSFINLAIKDEDPTRVLRECEEKLISDHPLGDPMLVRLGLERANPKIIHCKLHKYALDGADLDGINARFNELYCSGCSDRKRRADNWEFYSDSEARY